MYLYVVSGLGKYNRLPISVYVFTPHFDDPVWCIRYTYLSV